MWTTMKLAPAPVWLLVASFLCPTELSLYLADLRLPPHRVMLLVLVPVAMMRMLQRGDPKPRSYDLVFLTYNLWTIGIFIHHQGFGEGLQFGGSLALEAFGAYLVARVYIRDRDEFLGTLGVLVAAVAITGLLALPETLLGVHYIHDFLRAVTGYEHPIGHETRLSLTRAYGTFDHPIHLGTFSASALAMVWYSTTKTQERAFKIPILIGATMLGLSSAPILCIALQLGLIGWDWALRGLRGRVALSFAVLAALYIGAAMASTRSPLLIIATGFTLDSWTGFYRTVIWEHGLANVWDNPWIGIGLADWERPQWMVAATVDAFWLLVTMRAGIPAIVLLAGAILLLVHAVVIGSRRQDIRGRRLARGWIMSLIALALIACTVHLWNVVHTHFFFFIGMAGWLAQPRTERKLTPATSRTPASAVVRPAWSMPKPDRVAWPIRPPTVAPFTPPTFAMALKRAR